MAKAVFYDPQRRRWKHLRRVFDVAGILVTALIAFFIFTAFRTVPLPNLLLQDQRPRYHALKERERRRPVRKGRHRKTQQAPSQVVLNSDEGIRAAYYVTWDAGSFASLRENLRQIDLLYPEWLHVLTPDGKLQAVSADNRLFDVIVGGGVRTVDDKLMPFLKEENADTEVFPLVNNFDPISNQWTDTTKFFNDPQARANFLAQMDQFLATDKYRGLNIDFEAFPREAQPGYQELLNQLYNDLHSRGMKLYVNVPARNDEFNYAWIAAHSDGVILMDYDEHYPGGEIGPIASQDWFVANLQFALKQVPKEKLICSIGNYGYDWSTTRDAHGKVVTSDVTGVTDQEAWLHAHESDADVDFHSDSLNPHYAYMEGDDDRHEVWFLDAVTALNQMRAANELGIRTFALWRLGSEDPSLWSIWDQPRESNAPQKLENVPPGQDVDREGHGEILRIGHRPEAGTREISVDKDTGLIDDETFTKLPLPYEIDQYGASNNQIAITFDDGPDPHYTPKVLDILKENQVHGTFFLIGLEAQKFPGLVSRIYAEGNEIGNHTFTHPDISNISKQYMRAVELNLTERFFAARLGVKPVFFRPPYSIDQEPDTADEVRPLELVQDDGYVTVGSKNDPNDWKPHRTAQQIVADVLDPAHLPPCDKSPDPQRCGNVVLLHDGGGDRDQTLIALPLIIQGLKARGFQIVPASALLGKTTAQVMPPISPNERWSARLDYFGFFLFSTMGAAISFIFIFGDFLMSARLFFVGALAVFDRFRTHLNGKKAAGGYAPPVAVLIPAYNEEKVIERTVRAVLASDYPALRVIVIDDGSKDATLAVANNSFRKEIASGRVVVLTKPNGGKAEALNAGLEHVTEELFVGIDADTIIAPDAIGRLVVHFTNPKLGAIAGNTKVGNRVNLWTRWQALEYITSQNFERRALNTLGAVSVVPGALGAWRTAAVRQVGAYKTDTVAEDADLTMSLLEAGYRVEYDDRALAYTEAPVSANGLMRQRFRWSFGILQSVWKHRRTVLRGGTLGWVAIPNIVIFQILLPLVSPFIDIMFAFGALLYVYNRYFHPEAADPASFYRLVAFFAAFLLIDFFASAIAFGLERRDLGTKEDVMLLAQVWLQRFAYRQLFSIVLFKTLKRAVDGRQFSWDKLERTAAAALPARSSASPAPDRVLK